MGRNSNDSGLVKKAQQGDSAAFDALVVKYQYKITNLAIHYVKDEDEAQDIVQETFIKAYQGLAKFRGDSAFYTWLYRIAINSAKNYIMLRNRKVPAYTVDVESAENMECVTAMKECGTPERDTLTNEIEKTIYQAIRGLSDDLRTVITLREIGGLSYDEIAAVVECPIGTVRSRIFRAREAIDKRLKPLLS